MHASKENHNGYPLSVTVTEFEDILAGESQNSPHGQANRSDSSQSNQSARTTTTSLGSSWERSSLLSSFRNYFHRGGGETAAEEDRNNGGRHPRTSFLSSFRNYFRGAADDGRENNGLLSSVRDYFHRGPAADGNDNNGTRRPLEINQLSRQNRRRRNTGQESSAMTSSSNERRENHHLSLETRTEISHDASSAIEMDDENAHIIEYDHENRVFENEFLHARAAIQNANVELEMMGDSALNRCIPVDNRLQIIYCSTGQSVLNK